MLKSGISKVLFIFLLKHTHWIMPLYLEIVITRKIFALHVSLCNIAGKFKTSKSLNSKTFLKFLLIAHLYIKFLLLSCSLYCVALKGGGHQKKHLIFTNQIHM